MLLFSCSVMSDSLRPHGLQHTRLPCTLLSPRVCSNSCPLYQWFHPTISSSVTPSLPVLNLSLHQGLFQWICSSDQVAKSSEASTSTSVLPMNIQGWFTLGFTGLISFHPRDSQESSLAPQFESINSPALSFLCSPTLTSIHDYWKSHSFDYMDLCQQSDVFAFKYAV